MEETLERAIESVFGQGEAAPPLGLSSQVEPPKPSREDETTKELAAEALSRFRQAQKRLGAGDYAGYGQELKEAERALERLTERAGAK